MKSASVPGYLTRRAAVYVSIVLAHCHAGPSLARAEPTASPRTVVLAFGSNRDGKTGLGLDDGSTLVATPIATTHLTGKTITQVAAGFGISGHTLLLADDGTVFATGSNFQGQTGLGTNVGNTLVATPIDTSNLMGRKIAQVAAAWDYSLLLADDGVVFSFGTNVNGRTGLGTGSGETLLATAIDATNLSGKTINQIAAFGLHSLLLADDGTVFAFGWNSVGQTGQGTSGVDTLVAMPIDMTNLAGRKIVQLTAGADHNLLLADDGTVFSFGSNSGGETGLGLNSGATLIATPIDTTNLGGKRVTQVSAGGLHSLLLADDGSVFSFGQNSLGATGLGTSSGDTLVATPIDTTNLMDKTITQVSAGSVHSLLLADDGTVFSFGDNANGQTGLGTEFSSTFIATPIDTTNLAGRRVVGISAGGGYSLLLAVPEPGAATLLLMVGLPLIVWRPSR